MHVAVMVRDRGAIGAPRPWLYEGASGQAALAAAAAAGYETGFGSHPAYVARGVERPTVFGLRLGDGYSLYDNGGHFLFASRIRYRTPLMALAALRRALKRYEAQRA